MTLPVSTTHVQLICEIIWQKNEVRSKRDIQKIRKMGKVKQSHAWAHKLQNKRDAYRNFTTNQLPNRVFSWMDYARADRPAFNNHYTTCPPATVPAKIFKFKTGGSHARTIAVTHLDQWSNYGQSRPNAVVK